MHLLVVVVVVKVVKVVILILMLLSLFGIFLEVCCWGMAVHRNTVEIKKSKAI